MQNEGSKRQHIGFNPVAWKKLGELCEHYGLGLSPMVCVCVTERHDLVLGDSIRTCDLNAVQAYADRAHGGDLAKALNVLLEKVEGE